VKTILVAVDFSDVSTRVIDTARMMAKAFGAKVWLLHAVTDTSFIAGAGDVPIPWVAADDELPKHFPSEHGKLKELAAELQDTGVDTGMMLVSGPAIDRIITAADTLRADLIVLGSHGHGALYELLVGTVSEGVMRKAHRPVMIVPSAGKVEAPSEVESPATMATPY